MIPYDQLDAENARRRERGKSQIIDARAPQARPISGLSTSTGLTDPLIWANQFRRADNQVSPVAPTPSALTSATSVAAPAAPSITQGVLNEILPLNPFANSFDTPKLNITTGQGRSTAPSLETLAQGGGQNHAQIWSSWVAGNSSPPAINRGFISAPTPRGPQRVMTANDIYNSSKSPEEYRRRLSEWNTHSTPVGSSGSFGFGSAFR